MKLYLKNRRLMLISSIIPSLLLIVYLYLMSGLNIHPSDLIYVIVVMVSIQLFVIFLDFSLHQRKLKRLRKGKYDQEDAVDLEIIKLQSDFDKTLMRLRKSMIEQENYINQWSHEFKLPMSTLMLLTEKLEEGKIKHDMLHQIERMKLAMKQLLMSSKLQAAGNDMHKESINLKELIQTVIKEHSYFLIRYNFEVSIEGKMHRFNQDPKWLTYVLDQIIANSIKYRSEQPKLIFRMEKEGNISRILIEDNGIGIHPNDLNHIYEKGFVGGQTDDNQYKSTGMGLYFVKKAIDTMSATIHLESEYGAYTRFIIEFTDVDDFLMLE